MRDRFTGAFEKTAGTGSIKVIADNHMQPFEITTGTSVIEAEVRIREQIAILRAQADKVERRLETEGVDVFIRPPDRVLAPNCPFSADDFLSGVLIWSGLKEFSIYGRRYRRDHAGEFRPGEVDFTTTEATKSEINDND